MKTTHVLLVAMMGATLAGAAQAAAIVDWGGDYVTATQDTQRGAGGPKYSFNTFVSGTGNSGIDKSRALSLSSQLNPTIGAAYSAPTGKSETFYGGVAAARLFSGSTETTTTAVQVVDNGATDRIRLAASITTGNQNAQGAELFFTKTGFLNGFDSQTLSLDQSAATHIDGFSVNLVSKAVWTVKLAVINAGTFYIADYTVVDGLNALDSTALASMTFSSASLMDGSYFHMGGPNFGTAISGNTLNDVTAFGLIAYTFNAGFGNHSAELIVDSVQVSAVSVIPEPASVALLGLVGLCLLARRRRDA